MRLSQSADLWSGLAFTASGLAFALLGSQYEYGSAAQMGPGFFPVWLGGLLTILGLLLLLRTRPTNEEDAVGQPTVRAALPIVLSLLMFAILLERAGLIISAIVLLSVGSLATSEFRLRQLAIFTASLIAFVVVVFIALLGISIPLWPSFGA